MKMLSSDWFAQTFQGSRRTSRNRRRGMALETLEPRVLLAAAIMPGELVIQFNPGVSDGAKAEVIDVVSGTMKERIHTPTMIASGAGEMEVVSLPRGLAVDAAMARLNNHPSIAFAEPNWVFTTQGHLNDPEYISGALWGMYGDTTSPANQYGSQAGEAWTSGFVGSSAVVVGIIDEGIDYTHPDLAANIWTNPGDPVNGVDDDKNGYVDDIHGWDFANNDNSIFDGTTKNSVDHHGTHVAGTIGGVGGNGAGVAGVAWNVTMISAKFLGPTGGSLTNAIKAVDYLTNLKTKYGVNIVASNNSWGGGGFSQGLLEAITRAATAEILFIAAAGNSGSNNDLTASYPSNYNTTAGAGYDNVIAVAAIDRNGAMASFSSYGVTTVDLGAPGVDIRSTLPFNKYGNYSGTSMATPHVTGAAALYAASHSGANANAIRNAIISSAQATPTPSLTGKTASGGRLNVSVVPDVTPELEINNVSRNEGSSGTTSFTFTVSLSSPSTGTVTVGHSTGDGTASLSDYQNQPASTLTFAPGVTSLPITVLVNGDTTVEPNETFFVNLTTPSNAVIAVGQGTGTGTIVNDDVLLPSLSIGDVSKFEGNRAQTKFTFNVSLSAASSQTVSVQYATVISGNGSGFASAGTDYKAASGTISFSPGVRSATITILIFGDTTIEFDETFYLKLSNPTNATLSIDQGTGTIVNDDTGSAGQPGSNSSDPLRLAAASESTSTLDDIFSLLADEALGAIPGIVVVRRR